MIEPMAKAFVATREDRREELLAALRALGVLHLVPTALEAQPEDKRLTQALARTRRAVQALEDVEPSGSPARSGPVEDVVQETLKIQRRRHEIRGRLAALERETRNAEIWGGITRDRLAALERHGAPLKVLVVPDHAMAVLPGVVIPVRSLGNQRSLVICAAPPAALIPARATVLTPPERGPVEIASEIASLRDEEAALPGRLARLAQRRGEVEDALRALEDQASLRRALHGGLQGARLFGVQGWLPLARAGSLAAELEATGIRAAVQTRPADAGERPPTLVRYPRMVRPIRALFDLLGVRPGYDEADPTAFFMVAVPVFAGMLISDAGYGLVLLSMSLYALRRLRSRRARSARGAVDAFQLVMVFGAAALVWGAITGSWFGLTPRQLQAAGGPVAALGDVLASLQLVRGTEQAMRDTLIKICFLLGSTHLILAHLRRVTALLPDPTALADLGWCGVLGAMLGVIWNLFFREAPLSPTLTHALYGGGVVGFGLVALFSSPSPNPLVRVGKGIGGGLFPLIGAFGDTLSYIRLAAVGLASFYLAVAIDTLAVQAAAAGTWLAGAPILVVGHTLNMTLALVAILAHGVRLNLLEFSSHSGLQWAGYPYRPFAARAAREH